MADIEHSKAGYSAGGGIYVPNVAGLYSAAGIRNSSSSWTGYLTRAWCMAGDASIRRYQLRYTNSNMSNLSYMRKKSQTGNSVLQLSWQQLGSIWGTQIYEFYWYYTMGMIELIFDPPWKIPYDMTYFFICSAANVRIAANFDAYCIPN